MALAVVVVTGTLCYLEFVSHEIFYIAFINASQAYLTGVIIFSHIFVLEWWKFEKIVDNNDQLIT